MVSFLRVVTFLASFWVRGIAYLVEDMYTETITVTCDNCKTRYAYLTQLWSVKKPLENVC